MEEVVDLVTKVDEIFKQVINGKKDVFNEIDEVLIASLKEALRPIFSLLNSNEIFLLSFNVS